MTHIILRIRCEFYNHMPLSDIERLLEIPFEQYSLVISERSPHAKTISFANYRGEPMENSLDDIRRSVRNLIHTGQFRQVRNIDLYRRKQAYKELIVLRQESLGEDLAQLYERLELGKGMKRWPHAQKGTASKLLDPEASFTREQLDLVNEEFTEEFQMFGYEKF